MFKHAILQAYAMFLPPLQKQYWCVVDLVHISTVLSVSFTVFKHAQYNRLKNTQFHTLTTFVYPKLSPQIQVL